MMTMRIVLVFLATLNISSLKYLLVSLEKSTTLLSDKKARGIERGGKEGGNMFRYSLLNLVRILI